MIRPPAPPPRAQRPTSAVRVEQLGPTGARARLHSDQSLGHLSLYRPSGGGSDVVPSIEQYPAHRSRTHIPIDQDHSPTELLLANDAGQPSPSIRPDARQPATHPDHPMTEPRTRSTMSSIGRLSFVISTRRGRKAGSRTPSGGSGAFPTWANQS